MSKENLFKDFGEIEIEYHSGKTMEYYLALIFHSPLSKNNI